MTYPKSTADADTDANANANADTKADTIERLRAVIKERPSDAPTICARLNLSQPTFSRLWKDAGADMIRFGAARASRYAMTRNIGDAGSVLPIFEALPDGGSAPFGQLRMLQNDWCVFTSANGAGPTLLEGLPFWLQDLRPQGFLGRLVPLAHPDLALPRNIMEWTDDNTLLFLARRGEDVAGNLIVGNESYRRFLSMDQHGAPGQPGQPGQRADVIAQAARASAYASLAERANQGDAPGSSAGGEQPKFTAAVQRADGAIEQVIVKFTPGIASANGRRWADLLIAEHLALCTLRRHGQPACLSQIVMHEDANGDANGDANTGAAASRVYLEVVRFDRCAGGRSPIVSMAGVDCLLGALDKNWTASTMLLRDQRRLSVADWECVRLLEVFGALIGNSDRHPGNLSLTWRPDGSFALAPIYDMLPMMYQPNRQGEVVERQFDIAVLDRLDLRCLPQALMLAAAFWECVIADERISADFKRIARQHAALIAPK
jgi:hypothetical protein